ncbi:hypothetical protein DAD99_18550 [Pseudarthrobacter sp. AB1]|nr:hypothetical protein [Pseudarthrobacter sp. AB1]
MAAALEAVPSSTKTVEKLTEKSEAEAARELVRMAKEQGLALTGPDGADVTGTSSKGPQSPSL